MGSLCGCGLTARTVVDTLPMVSDDVSPAVSSIATATEDLSPDVGRTQSGATTVPETTGDVQRFVFGMQHRIE